VLVNDSSRASKSTLGALNHTFKYDSYPIESGQNRKITG